MPRKAASLVPPNVKMDVLNRRTVPGNVRSNQESIQLSPLTFYGVGRMYAGRGTKVQQAAQTLRLPFGTNRLEEGLAGSVMPNASAPVSY